ncbi:MAG: AAA family ATPase [Allosphingosinicella sp.]|uniref:AAA family ATPase n=1 Tax=Allosphingosinicella sp. TaxID=2823234 RepID=UPI00393D30D7
MKEEEFRAWMQGKDQAPNTVSTRLADCRRVEKHYGDLDAAYEADGFTSILDDLAYTAEDNAAGKLNTSRIQVDGDPYKSLASYRSAISIYRQFLETEGAAVQGDTQADQIRSFVVREYAKPAQQAGQNTFTVRAGDVHNAMGLINAMPAVCSAIGSGKFQQLAGVRQVDRQGPANSSTVEFTFEFQGSRAFGVPAAEAVLRERYGHPDVDNLKMVSFELSDGRAIALQRDIQKVQIWLEDDGAAVPPPAQQVQSYAADKGRHSNLPGRLSHSPSPDLRSQGYPKPVLSVRAGSEAELNNILDWYETGSTGLNRAALERLKSAFLTRYPDFEAGGFQAKSGGYYEEERAYKDTLLANAGEALAAQSSMSDEELGGRFLDLLTGKESGLLGWRTDARIKNLRTAHPGVLEREAGRLIRTDADLPEALEAFVQNTWPVLKEGQEKSQPYSESRNIGSMLAAFARPNEAYGINTDPVTKTARAVTGKPIFGYNPMTAHEYRAVLQLAQAIHDIMRDEWGWEPRDLWDVQGFIWAANRADSQKSSDELDSSTGAPKVMPTNLILYGPPGTGKTYATAEEAVRLCDGHAPDDRSELKARYDALVEAGQIGFVTFHQSYAYEDFVEGLRPTTDIEAPGVDGEPTSSAGFRLEPRKGVFREISALAEQARKNEGRGGGFDLAGRQFIKMSLGRAGAEDHIYDAAIEGGYAVLGWGGEVDWSDPRYEDWGEIFNKWNEIEPGTSGNSGNVAQTWRFRSGIKEGDLLIVSEGNSHFRAIGEVTGPYRYEPTGERTYNHKRDVKWHLVLEEPLPVETIYDGPFTMMSCYVLKPNKVKKEALARLLPSPAPTRSAAPDQFVLIIDEINRANISKVFGELITLIEADKRLGQDNALRLKLPYSGDTFGVPDNLHLIGTMNTADRSIALLDTALRRRFRFKELMPRPHLLPADVGGIDLQALLTGINDRIEYLFDREHQIGHAYFMGCQTKDDVDEVMRNKVIPLLAEYFYEDWEKVRQALGETTDEGGFVSRRNLSAPSAAAGGFGSERWRYTVRDVFDLAAYAQITA